jgi:N-acetylglucosamine malate deacetylase 1
MDQNQTVLIIAAHPDDEVLGCGGTIASHAAVGDNVHILIMAEGITSRDDRRSTNDRSDELTELAEIARRAGKFLGAESVELLSFPDNRMDSVPLLDVVKEVEKWVDKIQPSVVYTHHIGDVNVDHQVVHKAVVIACRPMPGQCVKTLLFFEIASSTEWQPPGTDSAFAPNWYENIGVSADSANFAKFADSALSNVKTCLEKKLEALKIYKCEMRDFPHSRSVEALNCLAKWRGATVGVEAAEAFMLGRKIV